MGETFFKYVFYGMIIGLNNFGYPLPWVSIQAG